MQQNDNLADGWSNRPLSGGPVPSAAGLCTKELHHDQR